MTGVHIKDRTREGGGTSPRWTTATKPSSAGYTRELEPGHLGRAKPAKATELQAPCVIIIFYFVFCFGGFDFFILQLLFAHFILNP